MFGHLMGQRIAVCVDTSDANMGFGRQTALQEALLVNKKKKWMKYFDVFKKTSYLFETTLCNTLPRQYRIQHCEIIVNY